MGWQRVVLPDYINSQQITIRRVAVVCCLLIINVIARSIQFFSGGYIIDMSGRTARASVVKRKIVNELRTHGPCVPTG